MSEPKILFVDDDTKILNAIERQLSDNFDLWIEDSPEAALQTIEDDGPFAVVVSDMRMPGMSGIEMLKQVRQKTPETVRIMLTGYADLESTIEAVNEGNIFRFLAKPCPMEVLEQAIKDGIRQYELVTAEKELVEGTLRGSIKVLFDVMGLVNPTAFGRASRVKRIAIAIAEAMAVQKQWEVEIAAMMCGLGCVTLPNSTLKKLMSGEPLLKDEQQTYDQHPDVGSKLLNKIPRLESVASMVAAQELRFDGSGHNPHGLIAEQIPIGARILKVALDLDAVESRTQDGAQALAALKQNEPWYDPDVVKALEDVFEDLFLTETRPVTVHQLNPGMVLAQGVCTKNGQLLICRGQDVTHSIIEVLNRFRTNDNLIEPLVIFDRCVSKQTAEQPDSWMEPSDASAAALT